MKRYCLLFTFLVFCMLFASCSDDEDNNETKVPEHTYGVYVLNKGDWGASNSSLYYYDPETAIVTGDVFREKNHSDMGDLAQDLCVYGSKMYVAMSGSACIHVLDRTGKSVKTIYPVDGSAEQESCRALVAHDGYIYASLYDGYVVEIDTMALAITRKAYLGDNFYSEGLAIANNKIYVANPGSWGESNTIAVLDLNSFEKIKELEVLVNPTQLLADDYGDVYLISTGNYPSALDAEGAVPGSLQRIDTKTDEVTGRLAYAHKMALKGDMLYLSFSEYNIENSEKHSVFNVKTEQIEIRDFIASDVIRQPNSISVDPVSGDVYISTYTYGTDGVMHVFNGRGEKKGEFTVGHDPAGAYFLTK